MKVKPEDLSGLLLARECVAYSNSETSAWDKCDELDELVAQATSAPQAIRGGQKPEAYRIEAFDRSGTVRRHQYSDRPFNSALDGALEWKGEFEVRSIPLYSDLITTTSNQLSEVERLRAELKDAQTARQCLQIKLNQMNAIQGMLSDLPGAIDRIAANICTELNALDQLKVELSQNSGGKS